MTTITDLYHALFGKSHIKDGDVIEFSEHGRSGGVSTGQGFKFVSIVGEAVNMQVDSGDANITYVGRAKIGTAGTVITWADSNDNYDNVFDNRESLTYG